MRPATSLAKWGIDAGVTSKMLKLFAVSGCVHAQAGTPLAGDSILTAEATSGSESNLGIGRPL